MSFNCCQKWLLVVLLYWLFYTSIKGRCGMQLHKNAVSQKKIEVNGVSKVSSKNNQVCSFSWFQVIWGKISMVDAEKRLLANALEDSDNQHFVLLSERCLDCWILSATLNFIVYYAFYQFLMHYYCCSCVPLYSFDYIYNYLINTNLSYVDR